MTKTQLLSTVAASLLLSVGIASAQSPSTQAPARAPAAQQSAPAEKVAPPMNAGERKGPETTGQSSNEKPGAATTGQAPKEPAGDMKGKPAERSGADMKAKPDAAGRADMKPGADKNGPPDANKNADKNGRPDMNKNKAEGANDAKPNRSTTETKPTTTTGQGAAAGSAKLSTEQHTKITTVIKRQNVQSTHLNVSINIGTRVPADVRFYPLPTEVVTIYPEWRGYDYILVDGRIVIIEPSSHAIVYIIES
jgi:hypothetical protein